MENLFFVCIALSPTQEAKLMEVQRACFQLCHHPSSYALPPVLPIACHKSFEKAHREWERNCLPNEWSPFVLSSVFRIGNILIGGPTPLCKASNPPDELDSLGLEAFPYLGGFYLSAIDPLSSLPSLPELPRVPVRVVRIQVLRITSVDPRGAWWRGIEWVIEEEKWVKLKRESLREPE